MTTESTTPRKTLAAVLAAVLAAGPAAGGVVAARGVPARAGAATIAVIPSAVLSHDARLGAGSFSRAAAAAGVLPLGGAAGVQPLELSPVEAPTDLGAAAVRAILQSHSLPEDLSAPGAMDSFRAAAEGSNDPVLLSIYREVTSARSGGAGSAARVFDGADRKAPAALAERLAARFSPAMPVDPRSLELGADEVRYEPSTSELRVAEANRPADPVVGHKRQRGRLATALFGRPRSNAVLLTGPKGSGKSTILRKMLREQAAKSAKPMDRVAVTDFSQFQAGASERSQGRRRLLYLDVPDAKAFEEAVSRFVDALEEKLPTLARMYGQARQSIAESAKADDEAASAGYREYMASISLGGGAYGVELAENPVEPLRLVRRGDAAPTEEQTRLAREELASRLPEIMAKTAAEKRRKQAAMAAFQAEIGKAREREEEQTQGVIAHFIQDVLAQITPKSTRFTAEESAANVARLIAAMSGLREGNLRILAEDMGEGNVALTLAGADGKPLAEAEVQRIMAEKGEAAQAVLKITQRAEQVAEEHQRFLKQAGREKLLGEAPAAAVAWVQTLAGFSLTNRAIFMLGQEEGEGAKKKAGRELAADDFIRASALSVRGGKEEETGTPMVFARKGSSFHRNWGKLNLNTVATPDGMASFVPPGGPTITPGYIHEAEGGDLVMHWEDVLLQPGGMENVLEVIRDGTVSVYAEKPGSPMGTGVVYHVPVKANIVIVAPPAVAAIIRQQAAQGLGASELKRLPIVELDSSLDVSPETLAGYVGFMREKEGELAAELELPGGATLSYGAMSALVAQAARQAGGNKRLTAEFGSIHNWMRLAIIRARERAGAPADGSKLEVLHEDVEWVLEAALLDRFGPYLRNEAERARSGAQRGAVTGWGRGVNGLAVIGGESGRLGVNLRANAAAVYTGAPAGVQSSDRIGGLLGPMASKAFIDVPAAFTAAVGGRHLRGIGFTVSYVQTHGVEGDSASLLTFVSLLASLGVPVRQDLAVTGSLNLENEAQVIGGIDEKTEAFYRWASNMGPLTGTQGVVAPRANQGDMQFNSEVAAAVASDRFHVYGVERVEEVVELFTGLPYSEAIRLARRGAALIRSGATDLSAIEREAGKVRAAVEERRNREAAREASARVEAVKGSPYL